MEIKTLENLINESRLTYKKSGKPLNYDRKSIRLIQSSRSMGCIECVSHGRTPGGYTMITRENIRVTLHSFLYLLLNPELELEKPFVIRHTCDNPFCCNPEHLIHGTYADNARDMRKRGPSRFLIRIPIDNKPVLVKRKIRNPHSSLHFTL